MDIISIYRWGTGTAVVLAQGLLTRRLGSNSVRRRMPGSPSPALSTMPAENAGLSSLRPLATLMRPGRPLPFPDSQADLPASASPGPAVGPAEAEAEGLLRKSAGCFEGGPLRRGVGGAVGGAERGVASGPPGLGLAMEQSFLPLSLKGPNFAPRVSITDFVLAHR